MRRALTKFAGWTALGLFFGSQAVIYSTYGGDPRPIWPQIYSALADWYCWALLSPAILWLGRRFPLARRDWWRSVPVLFVAGLLFTGLKIVLRFEVGQLLPFVPTMRVRGLLLSQFHLNLATFWVILGIGAAFEYYRKFRERELRASQLESSLAQSQLQVLRMQLQPHFLFNTLHTISALMQEGEIESADRMITRLSDLLRLALETVHTQQVRLAEELEFLQRYLDIQQIRFQDQLRVHVEIAPDTLDASVPSLILQPLVENAIKHGIGPHARGGTVTVRSHRENGMLCLEVRDDGAGLPPGWELGASGVGLANTRERLAQLYGAKHTFVVENAPGGGVIARLEIPG
jgi:signal transduction histidine kinase